MVNEIDSQENKQAIQDLKKRIGDTKQYQFAELIGVTSPTISRWLNSVDPVPKWLIKLLKGTGNDSY